MLAAAVIPEDFGAGGRGGGEMKPGMHLEMGKWNLKWALLFNLLRKPLGLTKQQDGWKKSGQEEGTHASGKVAHGMQLLAGTRWSWLEECPVN